MRRVCSRDKKTILSVADLGDLVHHPPAKLDDLISHAARMRPLLGIRRNGELQDGYRLLGDERKVHCSLSQKTHKLYATRPVCLRPQVLFHSDVTLNCVTFI